MHQPTDLRTGPRMPQPEGRRAPDPSEDLAIAGDMSTRVVQMQDAHQAVLSAQRDAVQRARVCGERLIELKTKVGERDWPNWVATHAGITMATARFYAKLARFMADPAKSSRVEFLSLNQVEMLVAGEPA